jgi:hypothetical protein
MYYYFKSAPHIHQRKCTLRTVKFTYAIKAYVYNMNINTALIGSNDIEKATVAATGNVAIIYTTAK